MSGIEDEFVRSKTMELFDNLVMQVKKRSDGTYIRRNEKSDTSVMSFVAPILEESPEYLEKFRTSFKGSPVDGAQSGKEEIKRNSIIQISSEKVAEVQEEQHESLELSHREEEEKREEEVEECGIKDKVCGIGPELPTADQFRQAAEIMDNMEYMEGNGRDDEDVFFIGPVPPEFEDEDVEGTLHLIMLAVSFSFVLAIR